MFKILVLLAVLEAVYSKQFIIQNSHGQTVWIGALGNPGKQIPNNGGFRLGPGEQRTITTADNWAGRFWARTGCSFDGNGKGHCDTGDCGNKLQCAGAGGVPPVTLAEFTLKGDQGQDFYDVSIVDGYNLGVQIRPVHKGQDTINKYRCGVAGCKNNLNANCPNGLRVKNGAGQTVACKSSCLAYNTDQYCCRGSYGTPQTCNTKNWAVNSATYFKSNCPNAYSYAYDDTTSTYTCTDSAYKITVY